MTKSFSTKDNDQMDTDFGYGIGWGFLLGLLTWLVILLWEIR